MSLAGPEHLNPVWTVGVFCALRDDGGYSDRDIAKKLDFNSVEDMHIQLENWKLPEWLIGARANAAHAFACRITHDRKQILTDEEIARKESHRKKDDGTSYSTKDVTELGDLGLSWS